jgi:hypothetical protein
MTCSIVAGSSRSSTRRTADCWSTRGDFVEVYAEDGRVLNTVDLKQFGYGFAQVAVCSDQVHAIASNIFTGIACKFEIATGRILAHVQTDHVSPRRALAGIAEFAG